MKHEINMQPGFTVSSLAPMPEDIVIGCNNLIIFNEVRSFGLEHGSKYLKFDSCIGVWQPKGTKLKRDADRDESTYVPTRNTSSSAW